MGPGEAAPSQGAEEADMNASEAWTTLDVNQQVFAGGASNQQGLPRSVSIGDEQRAFIRPSFFQDATKAGD